jgi:hypothetical protein
MSFAHTASACPRCAALDECKRLFQSILDAVSSALVFALMPLSVFYLGDIDLPIYARKPPFLTPTLFAALRPLRHEL